MKVSRMGIHTASLEAQRRLKGQMTLCSWDAGWRSTLLRAYDEPVEVQELDTAPTVDQLLVLVTDGTSDIEARYRGAWHRTRYRAGALGMTAPGEEVRLRWRGDEAHRTLQLHLAADMIAAVARELAGGTAHRLQLPNQLSCDDPVIPDVMQAMERAVEAKLPDLYADSAAHFLVMHVLMHHVRLPALHGAGSEDRRLAAVDAYLRDNLGAQVSLDDLAGVAAMSKFHLLRVFKRRFGEPPFRRLTRLRVEEAKRRLTRGSDSITEIAFACGYENPSHFAAAFRRVVGVSPTRYLRETR